MLNSLGYSYIQLSLNDNANNEDLQESLKWCEIKLMESILTKFKGLPLKYRALIVSIIVVILFAYVPTFLIFACAAALSYFFVGNKLWKYIGTVGFSMLALIFLVSSFSGDTTPHETASKPNVRQSVQATENVTATSVSASSGTMKIQNISSTPEAIKKITASSTKYEVVKVVDGDTVDVSINGKIERIRMIGIDTPETVDPRKPVQCFGVEASNKTKALLSGKKVVLESDSTQGERDKYNRLLRYVFLEDGTSFGLLMIREGYAHEYTYNIPYKYQTEFKDAQKEAMQNKAGLWGDVCQIETAPVQTTSTSTADAPVVSSSSCTIKGNINTKKEKIYHMIGCGSYEQTVISESQGERWFCTEQEAIAAGWRKALNCK